MDAKKELLRRLRSEREKMEISQGKLSEMMGVGETQVCRVDRGEQCSWNSLTQYMNALGLKFKDDIFERISKPE